MEFTVYQSRNKVNGKIYIGATRKGINRRSKEHIWEALYGPSFCKAFHAAIRKYGQESFEWSVLATLDSQESCYAREIELISNLKPEYNCTVGGEGIIGLERTPEWCAKISRALKGRPNTPENIARMRAGLKNEKSIVCLNDGKLFPSVKEAKDFYKIKGDISAIFRGEQITISGLYFDFSPITLTPEERAIRIARFESRRKRRR